MAFQSKQVYSGCSPLAVNCTLYDNPLFTTTASAGYYKIGPSIYYANSSGVITSITTACFTDVYVTAYVPNELGCYNYGTVGVYASAVVDTNIDVTVTWYGDLGGSASTTIQIASGTSCVGDGFIYTGGGINCVGEYISSAVVNIYPTSSSTQNYYSGGYSNSTPPPC